MENSVIAFSKYRLDTAKTNLNTARLLYEAKDYKASVNRSYYAIFHALRAVNVLENFDSKKHSGVIAHFNEFHVKSGHFNSGISKIIKACFLIRQDADYEDFYVISADEADTQITNAEAVLHQIENFLTPIYEKHEKETTT